MLQNVGSGKAVSESLRYALIWHRLSLLQMAEDFPRESAGQRVWTTKPIENFWHRKVNSTRSFCHQLCQLGLARQRRPDNGDCWINRHTAWRRLVNKVLG